MRKNKIIRPTNKREESIDERGGGRSVKVLLLSSCLFLIWVTSLFNGFSLFVSFEFYSSWCFASICSVEMCFLQLLWFQLPHRAHTARKRFYYFPSISRRFHCIWVFYRIILLKAVLFLVISFSLSFFLLFDFSLLLPCHSFSFSGFSLNFENAHKHTLTFRLIVSTIRYFNTYLCVIITFAVQVMKIM